MLWLSPLALLSQSVYATRSNDDQNYANDNLSDALQSTYCSLLLLIKLLQVPVESAHKVARQVSVTFIESFGFYQKYWKICILTFLKTIEIVNNDVLKVCKPVAQEVCANVEVAVPRYIRQACSSHCNLDSRIGRRQC